MKKLLTTVMLLGTIGHVSLAADVCEYNTKEKLLDYMQLFAQGFPVPLFETATGYASNVKYSSAAGAKLQTFSEFWKKCETVANLKGVGACFSRAQAMLERYEEQTKITGNTSLGFNISDEDYYKSLPEKARELPAELSNGLPDNYRDIAKQKGWKVIQYRSRTVGNPGATKSYNRVLFQVPGTPYDKWIQFTVAETGQEGKAEQLMDFISIDKTAEPKKIFFTQFWRNGQGKNPKYRGHGQLDSCYTCHPNGMRELSPAPGSYSKADAPVMDEMNKAMTSYGQVDWGVAMKPEAYGPPVGQTECIRCHNGYTGDPAISRGALTAGIAKDHMYHKLSADLSMPNPHPNSKKRQELQKFLHDVPNLMPEAERIRMNQELNRGGSPASYNHKVLSWLNQNPASGNKYLPDDKFQNYSAILTDWEDENKLSLDAFKQELSNPSQQAMNDWLLAKCDIQPDDHNGGTERTTDELNPNHDQGSGSGGATGGSQGGVNVEGQ